MRNNIYGSWWRRQLELLVQTTLYSDVQEEKDGFMVFQITFLVKQENLLETTEPQNIASFSGRGAVFWWILTLRLAI